MKADYVHKDTLTATDYVELNKNNELLISYNQALLKENQELKKQLHDASIQIQELIEKDIWCPSNCEKLEKLQQENKQLKEIFDKVIDKLGKYAIVIRSNGEAYTICVDLLDILKEVE